MSTGTQSVMAPNRPLNALLLPKCLLHFKSAGSPALPSRALTSESFATRHSLPRADAHGSTLLWTRFGFTKRVPLLSKDSKSSLVRHITVECSDGKAFHGSRRTEGHGQCIVFLRELQSLTVIMPEINEKFALILAYARSELMLRSYYGTCKPVRFDARILFPGLPTFHKDNFAFELPLRTFQLCGPSYADVRKRTHALIWGRKDCPSWVHADCQCTAPTGKWPAKFRRFRLTPDWDRHEQDLIKKNMLWAVSGEWY